MIALSDIHAEHKTSCQNRRFVDPFWRVVPFTCRGVGLVLLASAITCQAISLGEDPKSQEAASAALVKYAAPSSSAVNSNQFRALLVGCTKYDNLKPAKSLHGPANDVELVRRFFTEQLHLSPASITVLSELEAQARGAGYRPTRENIEREIQALIEAAKEGDQVVLLLAGHGGQQPERKDPDPTYLKPDGLDQMFLPCDCGQWDGKKWCVEKAIADYELRSWCKQITGKKARLWVVLDACCSGWTLRGNSTEVARNVSSEDLGIPAGDLAAAQQAAAARQQATRGGERSRGESSPPATAAAFDFGPQSSDYVGLYAAQRDESELEMPMPYGDLESKQQTVQGLLTYAVVDILSRASRPITYGELANLVRQRYPQWGRTTGPTPVVEGLAQDREVLGVQRWPGRSSQRWQKSDEGELTINAGQVQGVTSGTIVALYPSIDQSDTNTPLGYAKVGDCELMEATIKPVKYDDVQAAHKSALPSGGRFEVVWTDYGSLRLKIGVDLQSVPFEAPTETVAPKDKTDTLKQIAGELKRACAQQDSLCDFVDDVKDARWVVQWRGGKLILISQDAAQIRGTLPPEATSFRVSDDQQAAEIIRDMTRIARAQNLLNLTAAQQAASTSEQNAGAGQDDLFHPNVELKMLRYQSKADRAGTEIDFTKGPLVLADGDYVGWQMKNLGNCDVAVSLLYVDAGFGIKAIYPRAGAGTDNLLTKNGGKFVTRPAKITVNPAGGEHVVLVAIPRRAEQQSPDFSFLEQETLPQTRGGERNAGLESPLGRLLQNAMYGHGGTRGLDSTDTEESQLLLQSWRVSPETSP